MGQVLSYVAQLTHSALDPLARYLAGVTFAQLLENLPASDHAAWEAAATKELRGGALASIDLPLVGEPFHAAPYASATERASPRTTFASYGFSQVSDLTSLSAIAVTDLLTELEGGASGLFLDLGRHVDWSGAEEIRFDYITTCLRATPTQLSAFAKTLRELLPVAQRAEATVQVELVEVDSLVGVDQLEGFRELKRDFPQAKLVLSGPESTDPRTQLDRLLGEMDAYARSAGSVELSLSELILAYSPSAGYLDTLVTQRALQLLYANWCAERGLAEPLPNPAIWQRIRPEPHQSPEAYLIDATCRAVAGLSAGATQVSVRPHDSADAPPQLRRARNVLNVLAIEAHLGTQGDALRGATLVEGLAENLARRVWEGY